ncbi:MAG TPA: class I SAM-dependent methyltransferase [Thermoanaerobaculia bacterium]|nr:class I SAM-dependent methyltransferase [Thermoanaerobaculia bacterium]
MNLNQVTLRHPIALARMILGKVRGRLVRRRTNPAVVVSGAAGPETAAPPPGRIDVKELIARSSVEELNRSAEEYFSSLQNWDFHLAKPFGSMGDAPALLINFATVLQGLRIAPGVHILEFGAGTGWAARYLTQLGCRVTLLDVSPTALEIARELFRRHPVIGDQPSPEFLVFDGRQIDLPDRSVERILCFDAFHHAPNPDAVLAEFARVLVDGGIAAFAEPGPAHSQSEQSQHEMRTFGVVENDIDIRAIWKTAQSVGFEDLKLAAFHIPPFHLGLEEYESLLAGGEAYLRWAEQTRLFLGNVRNFFLKKKGQEPLDSRRLEGLKADIEIDIARPHVAPGETIEAVARITNTGGARWLPSGSGPGGVSLGSHLFDAQGKLLSHDFHWNDLIAPSRAIEPGETVEISFKLPPLDPGHYRVEFDCVADRICWFRQAGSATVTLPVEVG